MEDGYSSYNSLYDTTSLLQFCNDDSASATSGMEVTDRIASLEQRVQMQEDEIQLLKSALADVVRRLNVSEEQHAVQNRKGPTKARPLVQTLPLRTTINNGTVVPKKTSSSSPSSSGARKETISPATKSKSESLLSACKLNKANPSTVKRTSSTELVSAGGRRESFGDGKSSRNRTGSTSSSSSSKKNSESKPKEPMFSAGKRRVTHCKVTVQFLLTPELVGILESKKEALDFMVDPLDRTSLELGHTPSDVQKILALSLPSSSSSSQSFLPLPYSPSFKTALKSPSHYFQICY